MRKVLKFPFSCMFGRWFKRNPIYTNNSIVIKFSRYICNVSLGLPNENIVGISRYLALWVYQILVDWELVVYWWINPLTDAMKWVLNLLELIVLVGLRMFFFIIHVDHQNIMINLFKELNWQCVLVWKKRGVNATKT